MADVCRVCGARAVDSRCTLCGSTKVDHTAPDLPIPSVPITPASVPLAATVGADEAATPGPERRPLIVAVAIALVVVIGAAGWLVSTMGGQPSHPASAVAAASTAAQPEKLATGESPAPATAPAAQPSTAGPTAVRAESYPEVRVAAGQECARTGTGPFAAAGTANASTSCPFAINVRAAYVEQLTGQPGQVRAYSPTTKLWYDMDCSGAQPVLCTGGKAGRVIIYGGPLRVG